MNDFFSQSNPYGDGGAWDPDMYPSSEAGGSMEAAGAAGAMSGNPYALAASGGLKVLEMVAKRKEEERKAKYMAQLDHKDNIRGALDKLIGISQGLKNL